MVWVERGWNEVFMANPRGWGARGSRRRTGLDLAGELLEHQVLVLHLGDEARCLEEALAVPPGRPCASFQCVSASTPQADVSLVSVFLMSSTSRSCSEWKTWWIGGQADVLVDAAVAGEEVRVQHLVVVRAGGLVGEVGRGDVVGVRLGASAAWPDCGRGPAGLGSALCAMSVRNGVSKCRAFAGTGTGLARLPSTRPVVGHVLRQAACGPGMNLPYGSAAIIGMFVHVTVDELEARAGSRPAP